MKMNNEAKIKELGIELHTAILDMVSSSSDVALNKLLLCLDRIEAENPFLYRQLLGQRIARSLIEAVENEFDFRPSDAA